MAIPRKVLEVTGDRVRVDMDGEVRWVKRADHLQVAAGEHVAVYAGVALERIDEDEAREQLGFLRDLEEMFPAEDAP